VLFIDVSAKARRCDAKWKGKLQLVSVYVLFDELIVGKVCTTAVVMDLPLKSG
jgi:hypothetical protein